MSHPVAEMGEARARETGEPAGALYRWVFPALGVVSLVASCVMWSLKRPMWGDEVFSWVELGDRSLGHLLHAVVRLGGAGMPLYYLTAWPWAHVFGRSDLSLRLYACAGMCGGFLVLCGAMRRLCGASAAFLGTGFGMFASLLVVEQNCEARDYGLYVLLASLAVAQILKAAETERLSRRQLGVLALSQAGLAIGHVLGLIYCGLLLGALVAADVWQGRFRTRVYLWCMAGWLVLAPWIPAIQASMAVGRPHGWNPMPGVGDLLVGCSLWLFAGLYWQAARGSTGVLVAGWLAAVVCLGLLAGAGIRRARIERERRPAVLVALVLVGAPLVFFVVSHAVSPIFVPRYMLPSALGVAVLATLWAERSAAAKGRSAAALSCVVLLLPLGAALLARPEALNVARVKALANGQPVVCDSLKDFLVMTRYGGRVEYPMDPKAVLTAPGTDTDLRLMENYRREGYFPGQLVDAKTILAEPRFLVLDNQAEWFRFEVEKSPEFRWRVIAPVDAIRRLIEVERVK